MTPVYCVREGVSAMAGSERIERRVWSSKGWTFGQGSRSSPSGVGVTVSLRLQAFASVCEGGEAVDPLFQCVTR